MDAACSRYARLHGLTTLPELDEPDPWWAIPAPDADPQSSWLPDRHPVSVLELPELPELPDMPELPEMPASAVELGH